MKYKVITANSYHTIAEGFTSFTQAYHWAMNHDYGQWEEEGGWIVREYIA